MNAKCVVLAADSAATVGNKIYRTDKIFKLSRKQPIALMFYGNANISGIPLELLVNEYRSRVGDRIFNTVEECVKDFIDFIEKGGAESFTDNPIITEDHITQQVLSLIYRYWNELTNEVFRELVGKMLGESYETDKNLNEVFKSVKGDFEVHLENKLAVFKDCVDQSKVSVIAQKIEKAIDKSFLEEMSEIDSRFEFIEYEDVIVELIANMLVSGKGLDYTGIVVAGYGSNEYTPRFYEYAVYGLFYDGLIYSETYKAKIDHKNPSLIETFAQDDAVRTYLYGIDDGLIEKIIGDMKEILYRSTEEVVGLADATKYSNPLRVLNDGLIEQFEKDLHNYTYSAYKLPTESAVEFLSKDEMILMAESMINIMSLKKRVSDEEETVGGPVDVAVISRNEGLVWIKRKHYFNMELNPHYKGCKRDS
jgi:hypothetical protein